jgi:hypothetical protein
MISAAETSFPDRCSSWSEATRQPATRNRRRAGGSPASRHRSSPWNPLTLLVGVHRPRPEPATRRTGAYRGGTSTRRPDTAWNRFYVGCVRTHHVVIMFAGRVLGKAGTGRSFQQAQRSSFGSLISNRRRIGGPPCLQKVRRKDYRPRDPKTRRLTESSQLSRLAQHSLALRPAGLQVAFQQPPFSPASTARLPLPLRR